MPLVSSPTTAPGPAAMPTRQHTPEPCPSDDALAEVLSRAAAPEVVMAIRRHLRLCDRCRKAVAAASDSAVDDPSFLRPGSKLGRYAIEDVIGLGGMGIVYAAHDSVLDRKVALKVLLPLSESSGDERAWLEREAQAMAQLSHPNVVTVFDVGEAGSYLCLAMELVAGGPLSEWLTKGPDTARVLEVFLAAGRGLAAAHRAGIIHGDFKPSNVLVGDDGEVRVTDFGLALRATEAAPSSAIGVGGTPRYLAPERRRGSGVSVASDVYSYSASLYEALTHRHPTDDDTLEPLDTLKLQEPVRSAVRQGLASEPDERVALDDLLEALATVVEPQASRSTRGPWVIAGIGLTVIAGVTTWAVIRTEDPCANVESDFEEVWNPRRRAGLQGERSVVRAGFEESTSNRVDALLDAYASEWVAIRRDSCEAALVRQEESAEMMLQRLQCLDARKQAFGAVVEVLETPGLTKLEEATPMAAGLPPLSLCADDRYVSAAVPPPGDPATASQVEAVRGDLARVNALLDAPDQDAARQLADEALAAARELPYEPLLVEALSTSAWVFVAQGNYEAALTDANAAYERADAASRTMAAEVHRQLAFIHERMGNLEAALREARKSLGIASKVYGDEHPSVAEYHVTVGVPLNAIGRSKEALAEYERALEILDGSPSESDIFAAVLHNNIGIANLQLGNFEDALAGYRRALSVRELHLGPDHPDIGGSHNNIGGALHLMGRYEDALTEFRLGLAIQQASLGPTHPSIADIHSNIGLALHAIGDYEGSLKEHQEALAIVEVALDETHPDIAICHGMIGMELVAVGRTEAALAELRLSVTGLQASFGPRHRRVASARRNLAAALVEMGRYEDALDESRAALEIYEAILPPGHSDLGATRLVVGLTLHNVGRYDEALEELEQALELRRAALGDDHPSVGSTRLNLGMTLYAMGRYDSALAEFRLALANQRETRPPDHPLIAYAAAEMAFSARKAGSIDVIPLALEALDDVVARRPDDIVLPALRRMVDVITGSKGPAGPAEIQTVEAAREIIHEDGKEHFVVIADTWLAEHHGEKKIEEK